MNWYFTIKKTYNKQYLTISTIFQFTEIQDFDFSLATSHDHFSYYI